MSSEKKEEEYGSMFSVFRELGTGLKENTPTGAQIFGMLMIFIIGIAGVLIIGDCAEFVGLYRIDNNAQQIGITGANYLVDIMTILIIVIIGRGTIGLMVNVATWLEDISIMIQKLRQEKTDVNN